MSDNNTPEQSSSKPKRRLPPVSPNPGYPRGWFVVARCDELAVGGVTSMQYFGKKLVMFRGEDGKAVVLDAHCPHLGADLGVGGKVEGNSIRCPFHAWRFGPDGKCNEIPYSQRKIPPQARVDCWPVIERNGLIYVWHDKDKAAPDFDVPTIEGCDSDEWLPWTSNLLTIKTHPREIVENVADVGHFIPVHGTHIDHFSNEYDGHKAIQYSEGIAYPRGGGKDKFKLVATYYGPAFQVTEMESVMPNKLFNAHTPIDNNTLHLRFGVMLKVGKNRDQTEAIAKAYIDNLQVGFAEDIAIWENKKWRDRPMLCDGDGPMGKLRKWYSQFYQPATAAAE